MDGCWIIQYAVETALEAEGCTNVVAPLEPILNLSRLMIAPLLLVTASSLPDWLMVAVPAATAGATGLASAREAIQTTMAIIARGQSFIR